MDSAKLAERYINGKAITGFIFYGNGGDDNFVNQTDRPVWADLGRGNDRFQGGNGNDVVRAA